MSLRQRIRIDAGNIRPRTGCHRIHPRSISGGRGAENQRRLAIQGAVTIGKRHRIANGVPVPGPAVPAVSVVAPTPVPIE